MADTTEAAGEQSLFFRVPLEIRNEIYRYLLTPYWERCMGLDRDGSDCLNFKIRDWDDEVDGHWRWDDEPGTYTEILRVNRTIYEEAVRVLYSEMTIIVKPGDIICLAKVADIMHPNQKVWRYNPLEDTGHKQEDGSVTYKGPKLKGRLEPHVFARFEKVYLDLTFDWSLGEIELYLDTDFNVIPPKAKEFQEGLRASSIIRNFVKILSKSNYIRKLSVSLDIDIVAYYTDEIESDDDSGDDDDMFDLLEDALVAEDIMFDTEDEDAIHSAIAAGFGPSFNYSDSEDEEDDEEDEDDNIDDEVDDSEIESNSSGTIDSIDIELGETTDVENEDDSDWIRALKANERAIELFLDSGILDPLRNLTNVQSFSLDFRNVNSADSDSIYKPLPQHSKMLKDMKEVIESGFKTPESLLPTQNSALQDMDVNTPKRKHPKDGTEKHKSSKRIRSKPM